MASFLRSDVEPIDPSQVPAWVLEATNSQYFQVATATLLIYDTMITMDKEVKHFWKFPRRTVNIVYFSNRYIGILGAVSFLFSNSYRADLPLCNFAAWTRNIANWITVIFIDYILMIRVLALYSQDKRLSICLQALLSLEAAFKLGIFIYDTLAQHVAVGGLAKGVTVCGQDSLASIEWGLVDWIIPMVYGFILMALALYKAAEFWRMSAGFKGFKLVKILVADQLIYLILAVACSIFNVSEIKIAISNNFLSNVLEALGNPSFLCVLGSRMLINMKEAGDSMKGQLHMRSRSETDIDTQRADRSRMQLRDE